jgi:hypothetical protein
VVLIRKESCWDGDDGTDSDTPTFEISISNERPAPISVNSSSLHVHGTHRAPSDEQHRSEFLYVCDPELRPLTCIPGIPAQELKPP